ncbi:MAG: hypothetical protein KAG96_08005 [Ichthyobacteriaceae bacterium]|nr:hypothetical protein [Ichthyobacteriaceae bacterium]
MKKKSIITIVALFTLSAIAYVLVNNTADSSSKSTVNTNVKSVNVSTSNFELPNTEENIVHPEMCKAREEVE